MGDVEKGWRMWKVRMWKGGGVRGWCGKWKEQELDIWRGVKCAYLRNCRDVKVLCSKGMDVHLCTRGCNVWCPCTS